MPPSRPSAPVRPVRLVIFDCDGVLIDSEPLSARCLALALGSAGLAMTEDEIHHRLTGHPEPVARALLLERFPGRDIDTVLAAARTALAEAFASGLHPMPGIEALLDGLTVPACVASNSNMARLRGSLGLFPMIRVFGPHVYSAEMVARPKPAPDLLELCLSRTGTGAAHAVMVDDNPQGILAARAAGIRAIGFIGPSETRPDREAVLRAAGADLVAYGAAELARHLRGLTGHPLSIEQEC